MDLWLNWGDSKACTQMSGDSGCAIGMEKVESAISIRKKSIYSGPNDKGRLCGEVASLLGLKEGYLVEKVKDTF